MMAMPKGGQLPRLRHRRLDQSGGFSLPTPSRLGAFLRNKRPPPSLAPTASWPHGFRARGPMPQNWPPRPPPPIFWLFEIVLGALAVTSAARGNLALAALSLVLVLVTIAASRKS